RVLGGAEDLLELFADAFHAQQRDEGRHHLGRAFDDAVNAGVAQHALDAVLAHVPFAAPDLHRVVGNLPEAFGAEQLGDGGFEHDVPGVAIDQAGGHV